MHIKILELTDFRSFPSAQLEFSVGINLIVGHNNSGKSSIIKAIFQLQNTNSISGSDTRIKKDFSLIDIFIDNISSKARNEYFTGKNPTLEHTSKCLIRYKTSRENQEKKYAQLGENETEILRDFHDFPSSENLNNFIYPFLAKRKLGNYSTQTSTSMANAVLDTFQNLALKVQKVYSQAKTKKLYEKYCTDILGFIVTPITADNGLSLGVYSGFGTPIPIELMGDGVANVVGLLCILLTEDDKLFLIEELENDLHPAALKKLLRIILEKSKNNQFVISTHSNIVVKYLASEENTRIFQTEWSAYDSNEDDIPTSTISLVENTPQERLRLLESLGYEPFDFEMYKGFIILEESTAERLIRDYLIPWFVPQARNVLRTVAAQGVSGLEGKFEDFQKLFLYLHLSPLYQNRAWVFADGDSIGQDTINSLREKFKTWEPSHFGNWEKANFEDYYPNQFYERVAEISKMPHSKKKQNAKSNLLQDVVNWIERDPEAAKPLFEQSAKEVIEKIKGIIRHLEQA